MCPSSPAFAILLGPTNPQLIIMAAETLAFRCAGFSPALRLLVPAFSLLYAPLWVTPSASVHIERSLTDTGIRVYLYPPVSVACLNPDHLRRAIF